MHWRIATFGLISRVVSYARRTSSIVPPPVDTIIGLPSSATSLSSGVFVRSPEAILYAGISSSARNSALLKSNAVEKNVTPSSAAYALSSSYSERPNSSASRWVPYVGPYEFSLSYGRLNISFV